jgi:glycosyltransferase involved in cell wall biosynthesis
MPRAIHRIGEKPMHHPSSAIIATCEPYLGGAGKIATQILREFSRHGYPVDLVCLDLPHLFENVPGPQPQIIRSEGVTVNAIPEVDLFIPFRLAESMIKAAAARAEAGLNVTLWGTYLIPYAAAAHLAAASLRARGVRVRLVVSPAGSDIWQVGPQLHHVIEQLLFADAVDARLTYTQSFAREIQAMFGREAPFHTVFPILDLERFRPCLPEERETARHTLDIPQNSFVICCHCNMRPIKQPEKIVALAKEVADRDPSGHYTLLMIGPADGAIRSASSVDRKNLTVIWTGPSGRVEYALRAADVAANWSAHDSFNGSLMEAMGLGLPLVSTNVVGIGPEIAAAGAGALFAENEISLAAEYMLRLAHDHELREQMAQSAAAHAAKTFGAATLFNDYARVLLEE